MTTFPAELVMVMEAMRPFVAAMLIADDGEIPVEPKAGMAETEGTGAGGDFGAADTLLEDSAALVTGGGEASAVEVWVAGAVDGDADAAAVEPGELATGLVIATEPAADCGVNDCCVDDCCVDDCCVDDCCGAADGGDVQAASSPSRPHTAAVQADLRRCDMDQILLSLIERRRRMF